MKITGTVENMSGKYKIEIEDKKEKTILGSEKFYEATGYMVINENHNHIDIMEKTTKNEIKYTQWTKLSIQEDSTKT